MSKILNLLAIVFFVLGLIAGLGVTIYLFTYGIDLIKNGNVFGGLLYVLAWSELGGIAVGLGLIYLGGLLLNWGQPKNSGTPSPGT